MTLKAKLARLSLRGLSAAAPLSPVSGGRGDNEPAPQETLRAVELRARLGAMRSARSARVPSGRPADAAAGSWLEGVMQTPAGPLCRIVTNHPQSFCQGRTAVAPCLSVSGTQLADLALDAAFLQVRARHLLFVDTETTGLCGGAGTLPFLIGVGYFIDDALRIEQWMLRRPGQEVPMLTRLAECLAQADAIVTYNGKSFDWPLLRNRFILNGVKMPAPKVHLDLLHCTRRLLKKRLPSGALQSRGSLRLSGVERDVLGFERQGDIDGAQIPERYFRFLRGGPATLLDSVIEHNRHDLVSLAALLGYVGPRLADTKRPGCAEEHLNLAHIALRGRHPERAVAFAAQASLAGAGEVRWQAALLLGQMLIRQRQFAPAAAALEAGLAPVGTAPCAAGAASVTAPLGRSALHLALAKLFEHRLHDIPRAQLHAAETLRAEGAAAQARRLRRLLKKAPAPLESRPSAPRSKAPTEVPAAAQS